ncbi:MAG TPA: M23 family metallopeptidase, partial [Phaeodactylibacter sp.]|nr:M23 family metallopeptidase [Phaeodactylibacter sp.]
MRKEKFVYNTQTLRYEKVVEPLNVKIFKAFGFFSAVLVTAIIMIAISYRFFPSPKEKALMRELDQMKNHYAEMSNEVASMSKVLNNIHERDGSVNRLIFGMEPMDEGIWEGGTGGSDKFRDLTKYERTGNTLIDIEQRIKKMKTQLTLQSKSLDEIEMLASKREEQLASLPAIKPVREDKLKRRIQSLSGFGMRMHPIYKRRKMHTGLDFTCPKGTSIQATGDGVVEKVIIKESGYGHHVVINHGFGYKTLYGHMSVINVKKGQKVTRGQKIGEVGSTGTSTGSHLHYEVIAQGKKV